MARKKLEQTFSTPVEPAYKRCEYKPGCIYPARLPAQGIWVCTDCYGEAIRAKQREPGEEG